MTQDNPLVAIIGPTAVGKTEISIHLAERLGGEIVSADSRLLYRGMDIGTDKPSVDVRSHIPHHLIDVTDPDQPWSLAIYRRAAIEVIDGLHGRGCLPLLVGGTGQYITAILEGWIPPPKSGDPSLRQQLEDYAEERGSLALHMQLEEIDPASAAKIDHRNVRRVVRALEIYHITGSPPSQQRASQPPPYRALRIGLTLPRSELYTRIDARIDAMLDAGLIAEVEQLLERGYDPDLPAMTAIGYRQITDYLRGSISLDEAIRQMRKATRQFVRRQSNWFKKDDARIHWFDVREDVIHQAETLIRSWLEG
ncbi:MAG: tRNA (adenosine(37)-N6)-dimethylallyltransferase MiaA [Anaerolineaceae bacterium]|nr:MAG: tRNA (adenosine(37)-N6)-dimethylallyltransferase MiaA [Anaerolineaceae bacterium]